MAADPVCAFGWPVTLHLLPGPLFACQGCAAESERLAAAFREAVAAGTFNEQGYTPAEWRASTAARLRRLTSAKQS